MKGKYYILFFTGFLLVFPTHSLSAQESFNSGGGDESAGGISLSYSIGQPFYQSFATLDGAFNVSPGVQQQGNTDDATFIPSVPPDMRLYPNPATDFVELYIQCVDATHCKANLIGLMGNALASFPLTGEYTQIDVRHLAPGVYFLQVIEDKLEIKLFKIIKK